MILTEVEGRRREFERLQLELSLQKKEEVFCDWKFSVFTYYYLICNLKATLFCSPTQLISF